MKIGVIGTVGVPARYGGFETLAEQLARGIDPARNRLVLYCQRSAYPELAEAIPFEGHERVLLPMRANGASSMVHDAIAMIHAATRAKVNAMLVLGYSGAWFLPVVRLLYPRIRIVTNVDGMEWRRDKFGRGAKLVLRALEWFAVRCSHCIIADNTALVGLLESLYAVSATTIAYGGDHTLVAPADTLPASMPAPGYALSVARIEPENNSRLILSAFAEAGAPIVSVGNWSGSEYGRALKTEYGATPNIVLLDPIYDTGVLAALRRDAGLYVHGHSVGGTNPSLVEAIFHHDRILAFDCAFNRATLNGNGRYFSDGVALQTFIRGCNTGHIADVELTILRQKYKWRSIVDSYLVTLAGPDNGQNIA